MHAPNGNNEGALLAFQVVVLTVFSGIVAWLQRWKEGGYRTKHLWRSLLIDVVTTTLVGFSVWISARHMGSGPDIALATAIVAGHYGGALDRHFGAPISGSRRYPA